MDMTRDPWILSWDYYTDMLRWMLAYVWQNKDKWVGECQEKGGTFATTFYPFNERTEYYASHYYNRNSVRRASTLIHEVRHSDLRKLSAHVTGGECSWGSCDQRWSGRGSRTWELLWLAALHHEGDDGNHPAFIDSVRTQEALDYFYLLRTRAFVEEVQWDIHNFSLINYLPDFYIHIYSCSESPHVNTPCIPWPLP